MKTNYFNSIKSLEELKKLYKELAMLHHPDRGGDTATMQEINSQYHLFCENPTFSYKYPDDKVDVMVYPEVLAKILNLKGIVIELIGAWLWVSGNTQAHKEQLKAAGFWFAPKKSMWYYRPQWMKSHKHNPLDINAIRNKYGSDVIHKTVQEKIN